MYGWLTKQHRATGATHRYPAGITIGCEGCAWLGQKGEEKGTASKQTREANAWLEAHGGRAGPSRLL